ncbi:Secreted protein [Golovinomyces cichoracearum]|uniref:Secreted protein n=1 Tax=Golovinomyces cichoracearum TaxID=62708 RepID=A0A420J261_9PEZI|nr:Secreted protein [Golovinomyces cichoracearum]
MAKFFLSLMFISLTVAEQPGSAQPVTPPQRDIQIGQLNFLQTTDVHGWNGGHQKEGQYSADFGDYISFTQRMREKIDAAGADLILIDTGDRVDGNGLYDGSKPKGIFTYEIVKKLEYDVLTIGNHELYLSDTVDEEYSNLSSKLKETYLASNLDYIDPKTGKQIPMGKRYRVFRTKNQGINVAAFGFIFNFDRGANNSKVQPVEETVKEDWFQAAIREEVDLFLVCGHIPLDEREFKIILKAIRSQNKDTPIQVFGAHTHVRNFMKYDSRAYGMQSGRYMETVGWTSMNGVKTDPKFGVANNGSLTIHRRYIDNNILAYHFHSGLNASTFPTDYGKNVSSFISEARKSLDLDYTYGFVPQTLYLRNAPFPSNQSILSWMIRDVLPDVVLKKPGQSKVASMIFLNSGFLQFDLEKGPFTRDTIFIIAPFPNKYLYIKKVPYEIAKYTFVLLDQVNLFDASERTKPDINVKETRGDSQIYGPKLIKPHPSTYKNQISLASNSRRLVLRPGYNTVDDGGSDGDDTPHIPLRDYEIPDMLQTSVNFPSNEDPKTVDLIFVEYLQPSILSALNLQGLKFNQSHVEVYREELANDLIAQWVKENWPTKD